MSYRIPNDTDGKRTYTRGNTWTRERARPTNERNASPSRSACALACAYRKSSTCRRKMWFRPAPGHAYASGTRKARSTERHQRRTTCWRWPRPSLTCRDRRRGWSSTQRAGCSATSTAPLPSWLPTTRCGSTSRLTTSGERGRRC